ncbi:30S ribosomal protein S7 [Candidatus Vampirococcus lugosii]|uniref:Small ribosomal subunit protein uS7 n=1 Tax=Candidatus Vampirococcus lugosii TaxID=2789015 RepID=A0ABS5QMR3_9BACT|nr:30S ribosomal protein S7 [Candidatus Vampirococcus lugosii]MBS8121986.1 30S ribosomal protein S7 [Candidatus Vampirococcus lugosii]
MSTKFKKSAPFSIPSTNPKIEKFINHIMKDGKKTVARKIFYDALDEIKKNGHMNPYAVWEVAIENASPNVMIKSKRIGGAVYQVPLEVKTSKKFFYSTKWLLSYSRAKKGVPMYKSLAEELLAAYSNQGSAVKKKEDTHKMADANKAYAYLAKYVK